jgi:hypothetical protein
MMPLDPLEVFRMVWDDRMSTREMEAELGVEHSTLIRYIREHGIPRPNKAESRAIWSMKQKLRKGRSWRYVARQDEKLREYYDMLWEKHGCDEWLRAREFSRPVATYAEVGV